MFIFKELVLENKNISKIFYLYDELSSNKNMDNTVANEFINESIVVYENTVNKIKPNDLKEIELWIGNIKSTNNYEHIDELFSNSVLTLENKIKSKKIIIESLTKTPITLQGSFSVPVKTLVETANKTVKKYVDSLDEDSKKSLIKILSEDENKLQLKYDVIKESVMEKLEDLKTAEKDKEVIEKIDQTLSKLQKESFDRITYFKLQELHKNL